MNVFNRVIMIILLLGLLAISAVAAANLFIDVFDWKILTTLSERFAGFITSLNQIVLALVLFLVIAVSLILLIFEFYRRKIKTAKIPIEQK